jgi:hypothetical protein
VALTSFGHLGFDVVERDVVFADVVRHVAIGIHSEQLGAAAKKRTTRLQAAVMSAKHEKKERRGKKR